MHDPFNGGENREDQAARSEDEREIVSDGGTEGEIEEPCSSGPDAAGFPAIEEVADLSEWKTELRREFEEWLEMIEAVEEEAGPEPETPDLYAFYEAQVALTAESRKANRRTAEALSQWTDLLKSAQTDLSHVRIQLLAGESRNQTLPRPHCLALLEFCDRLDRLGAAFRSPPQRSWWRHDDDWRRAWNMQRHGFDILRNHLAALLDQAGIARIDVLGKPFDPVAMSAAVADFVPGLAHHTVLEEIVAGYRQGADVLRLAQVKVNMDPSARSHDSPKSKPPTHL